MRARAGEATPADGDLVARVDALLPQTQCRRCGYPSCPEFARAVAGGLAPVDGCPPGGGFTAAALARLLGLHPAAGPGEDEPATRVASIEEARCIGCALCLPACPVDAIVGAGKRMHTVLAGQCTGCELCVAPCPVDCIRMVPVPGIARDPQKWLAERAPAARTRFDAHRGRRASRRERRRVRVSRERLRAEVAAAVERVRARRSER